MSELEQCRRDLVVANRILANQGVVDAFGHASVRHPERADRFILSYSRAPELVTLDDLGVFDLEGEPIEASDRKPYAERFIHAGIYAARPDVHAVIHNHSYDVIPFGVTAAALRPLCHVGAVMGEQVKVWDIRRRFHDTNLLVVNMEQARDLARTLGGDTAVLMRGHGCAVVGRDIRAAVVSAVYMQVNARLQTVAMGQGEVEYLTAEEIRLAASTNLSPFTVTRLWECWQRRALGDT